MERAARDDISFHREMFETELQMIISNTELGVVRFFPAL